MTYEMLTLGWNSIAGDRFFHHFQHLDCLRRRRDLIFVVMQNVQTTSPVSFESRVAHDNSNIWTFAGCE